jgi:ppGpp synthetase/RelA/SpoT-type nucleotidyltranferase
MELWLPLKYQFRLPKSQDSIGVVITREMKPKGMANKLNRKPLERIGRHAYSSGLDLETKDLLGLRSMRSFFLDIPFYKTH